MRRTVINLKDGPWPVVNRDSGLATLVRHWSLKVAELLVHDLPKHDLRLLRAPRNGSLALAVAAGRHLMFLALKVLLVPVVERYLVFELADPCPVILVPLVPPK